MGKGGTEINYPAQQGYGESMRESLQAQIDLAPQLYGAEASQQYGRPAYAQLETDILRDTLLGQERFTPQDEAAMALSAGGAAQPAGGGQPVSVAGGKYLTIYRPGTIIDQGAGGNQRQFSVDLIDPQTGQIVMSETGQFKGNTLGGPLREGYDTEAINQAMQSLFGTAQEQGLMTAPEATQAVQQFQQVGTEAGAVWSGYAGESGDPGQMDAWRDRFRAGDPEVVGAVTELGGDPNMSDDELARFHYDKFGGRDAGFAPPPVAGTVARSEGLLDILGGTATGRFGTGEVVESATQPGVPTIGMEERRAGYDPQGGFMGLAAYGSDIAEQAARRTRAADIGDVSRFAGVTREAMEAADPLSADLLGAEKWGLGAQAQEGLEAGRGLSPRQKREAEQAARAGWEARGLIRDPEAVVSEVESVMEAGGAEEAKRRAFAQNVMGVSQAMTADPFMAILGRPSGASQQIAQQGLGAAGYGLTAPQNMLFDPSAGLGYMMNQQTNLANIQAAQQAAAATRSAGMAGGLGALGGGIAQGAIMACWIAREVYGESNPKWMIFREWLLNKAPEWFKLWYLINGEQVAEWLKDKPGLKARIRLFMDSKVGA